MFFYGVYGCVLCFKLLGVSTYHDAIVVVCVKGNIDATHCVNSIWSESVNLVPSALLQNTFYCLLKQSLLIFY